MEPIRRRFTVLGASAVCLSARPALALGIVELGHEFQVNTYTAGQQSSPAVAADADGDFVVVWYTKGQDGDNEGVFGQRYDSSGAALGAVSVERVTSAPRSFLP